MVTDLFSLLEQDGALRSFAVYSLPSLRVWIRLVEGALSRVVLTVVREEPALCHGDDFDVSRPSSVVSSVLLSTKGRSHIVLTHLFMVHAFQAVPTGLRLKQTLSRVAKKR